MKDLSSAFDISSFADVRESREPIDISALTDGLTNTMTSSMKDLSSVGALDINSLIEKMSKPIIGTEESIEEKMPAGDNEIYVMLSSKLDTMIEKLNGQNGDMVNVLEKHLAQMVSKLEDSNDLQGKMLQYSKV
jgi:hypothetical protein